LCKRGGSLLVLRCL
nr:immunoglobulin heavy chain junction region [Mus musculus]MBK4198684.1 immunoglobulin heavy chain junction region [Mus musculus]